MLSALGVAMTTLVAAQSSSEAGWLRYPSISPDGSSIVFTYKGDLYKVTASGGNASLLTMHEAHDYNAIWSPDGKYIAFASDRYGNFDVFVMPATGGEAKRLTYHSAGEVPFSFTPDGKNILFGAARMDVASNRQFPTGSMPELYSVSVNGGRVQQVLTTPAEDVKYSADGKRIFYHDKKGGENTWRKHHTSSIARDIWMYDVANGTHKRLTGFAGEDRSPVLADGDKTVYYLSEASGSFNVYKMNADGSNTAAVTNFKTHPVRFLSAANNGTLCFGYDGQLYTHANGKTNKVNISIVADARSTNEKTVAVGGGVGGMKVSPNGKEVAYLFRGDVFVSNADGSGTKQVTKTAEAEEDISWHSDGRMLVYSSERNGKWSIYKSEIVRKEEPYFYASTLVKETVLLTGDKSVLNPDMSPNGKELAYVENYNTLKVLNLASNQSRTLVTQKEWLSWGDGGHGVSWSPDSKWLLVSFSEQTIGNGEIGILSADDKQKIKNITQSGFGDSGPKWMMNGKMILWFSDRDGLAAKANSGGAQRDAYGLFFTQDAWDNFKLSKDEAALAKELKEKAEKADTTKKAKPAKDSVIIDWAGLDMRKARLTIHSSSMSDALVDNAGENLYYLTRFERGVNLWSTNLRTRETKILAPLGANGAGNMQWDKEGKKIYLQTDGGIAKIDPASGKVDRIGIGGEMMLDVAAERQIMFEHVVRRTADIFYKQGFHGIEWNSMSAAYRKQLPHVGNGYEFSELLSELLGELNVSHCGSSYSAMTAMADATASLGVFYDYQHKGNGVRIEEVIAGGPLDKAGFNIAAGTIIESIDGETITADKDLAQYLNRKAGKNVLLVLNENGKSRELVVKPISTGEENGLLYKRWVKRNADEVDRLSNGQLGYIHVPGMNDGAYRTAIEEAMGKYAGRKALVVDTRNNGGGDLVADLTMWLSGKRFMEYSNDKEVANYEPTFRWNKPSISLANEANYSDGHCYAFAYKYLQLGKVVGMPVPGTCSFAAWEMLQDGQTRWGTVPMGVRMMDGSGKYLENFQTEPDIKLMNEYTQVNKGKDQQLEAAVAELLKEIK
ncbi:S41 family peptidase [Phnomibacter sp. MR]|uniref:S41 family peptidase n=1 Tax=Phnomibacter sp. MR TaxID=3042318 RepID=UPI003A7FD160